jgi:amphi-Trp domain-containing protein
MSEDTESTKIAETPDTPSGVDVEKAYGTAQVVAKLRRLADALEAGKHFEIQIAGNRIKMPPTATIEFEYQSEDGEEEIEIEMKWSAE